MSDNEDNQQQDANQSSQAIAIRPPPFSTKRVPTWFTVIEAQFGNVITSEAARFRHVISNLPLEVCEKLTDADLTSNNYTTIKAKVISLYSKTNPQIFNELLTTSPTLDCKPSIYLQKLRSNAASLNLPDEFLKIYFINAMPTNIRPNLITQNGTLDEISLLADSLLEFNFTNMSPYVNYPMQFNPTSSQVNNTYQNSHTNRPHNRNNNTSHYNPAQYNNPSNYSTERYNQNNFSQLASNDTPLSVRSFNGKQKPKVCRFHIYYGHSAKRCKPWCILNNPSLSTLPTSRPQSRSSSPDRHQMSENY